MKKVAFYTLGCKLNFSETSTLSRQLREKGFSTVPFESNPDVFVINTCSVTENADRKCRKIVRDAKSINANAKVVIIGCYAQLKPQEIVAIPGVDMVLGASEKFDLPNILANLDNGKAALVMACEIANAKQYHSSYSIDDRTRSFLKVQDGCDYGCTFCTIPLARGKSRSDTIPNILKQVDEIVASGSKEIVLTGVNTGDFGIVDGKREYKFIQLLRALQEVSGIHRIRISSIEPNLLTEEIVSLVADSSKIVPHFHIPLQSGSDTILKGMRRRYLTPLYNKLVLFIKEQMPHCCIGVDVMVGFPGETNELFLESYSFLRDLPVSYLHVFSYSERPNTLAAEYDHSVPKALRHERSKMLRILSDKKRRAFYQEHLGQTHQVLIENDLSDGRMYGFTRNYIRVGLPENPALINEEVKVVLDEFDYKSNIAGKLADPEPISVCNL